MWSIAYPFLVILLVALVDSNVKGRAMARYGWDALPDWLRDRGVLCWRSVLAGLVLCSVVLPMSWSDLGLSWRQSVGVLLLGSSGVESVLYWWLLRPLGIKQHCWWKDYGLGQPASWFDYPPSAPWLRVLPGFWWCPKHQAPYPGGMPYTPADRPTRREVYAVAAVGVALSLGVMLWP